MKKYWLVVVILFSLTSCEQDIQFNNSAFQGLKNKQFWRATNFRAIVEKDEQIIIEGSFGYEKVILKLNSIAVGTYPLGKETAFSAEFSSSEKGKEMFFTTANSSGNGKIAITNYDIASQTISGTFVFYALKKDLTNATDSSLIENVQFSEGVFYKILISKVTDN